ncbi:MAG TPA: hypothetical protein VF188_10315 [Longimicrobiales bacterium]
MGPLWAWLLGFIVLLIVILILVDRLTDRRDATVAAPAAAERARSPGAEDATEVAVPLSSVLPFDPASIGQPVLFDGDVVGAPVPDGVWVRLDGGEVVFLRILDGVRRHPPRGERVTGRGIVRRDARRVAGWRQAAGLSPMERSAAVPEYYVETTMDRLHGR